MQVAAVGDRVRKDDMNVVAENVKIASQVCVLSSGEEASRALKMFLHERLDVLSGEVLEKIVEVDMSRMLAFLEKSNVGHRHIVGEQVEKSEQSTLGDVDRILRSELVEGDSSANKSLSSGEGLTVWGGPPWNSVMFNLVSESTVHESTDRRSGSVANLGQSFLSTPLFDGTEYGTSELESLARKRTDEFTRSRVSVSEAIHVLSVPRGETQTGLFKGHTRLYPCYSAL